MNFRGILKYWYCGLLFISTATQAQYFNFSQYDQTPLRVNPAYVVASDYEQVNLIYRNQNTAAEFDMNTGSLSYQRPIRFKKSGRYNMGIGVSALNDRTGGATLLNNQHLGLSTGGNINLNKSNVLSIGFSGMLKRKHFSLDGLTSGFQYNDINGFDPKNFIGEDFSSESKISVGINAGLLWQKKDENGDQLTHLGWALYDVNEPNEFFNGSEENRLLRTNVFQLGARAYKGEQFSVYPQVLILTSGKVVNINTGIIWEHKLMEKGPKRISKIALHTNYVIGSFGSLGFRLHGKKYSAGLSYDLGFASTQVANTGAIEISFTYHKLVREKTLPEEIVAQEEEKQNELIEWRDTAAVQLDSAVIAVEVDPVIADSSMVAVKDSIANLLASEEKTKEEELPDIIQPLEEENVTVMEEKKSEVTILSEYRPSTSTGELIYSDVRMEKVNIICEFDFNQAILKREVSDYLEKLAGQLIDQNIIAIEIIGHTDAVGSEDYNMQLSTRRAHAIGAFLAERGIAWSKMSVTGKGESQPITIDASNEENRRVEVLIFSQQ